MPGIMDVLAKEMPHGERYRTHKICYDTADNNIIEYEQEAEVTWKEYGETTHLTSPRNLLSNMQELATQESWFRYFLDGSRHTYKIDDMAFFRNVYPILAGQVGISCCRRDMKVMQQEFFRRKLVLVLPNSAIKNEFNKRAVAANLCKRINESGCLGRPGIQDS